MIEDDVIEEIERLYEIGMLVVIEKFVSGFLTTSIVEFQDKFFKIMDYRCYLTISEVVPLQKTYTSWIEIR